jgi:tetratricopeptide (TPR) repeat protein
MAGQRNTQLEAVIRELGWSQERLASHMRRVAAENGATELRCVSRSHVAQWLRGVRPSGRAPLILCETLSRHLGRAVTPADIGLASATAPQTPEWDVDMLTTLVDLGGKDLDINRRQVLAASAYSAASLALPPASWWQERRDRARARNTATGPTITAHDVETLREGATFFSRLDQRRGGGSDRKALVAFLCGEMTDCLRGRFSSEQVRRDVKSAAGELIYLAGWTAFDAGEHALADYYFRLALHQAAEADDDPLAGHILRAMAHQALDLGHPARALDLATASLDGGRYHHAVPRERALLGVVHARCLAATGRKREAAAALRRAEDDLRAAAPGADEEPGRVWFFGEASLAHETGRTLNDLGDLQGAEQQFRRSVRTRRAQPFARTHAVTLGLLGGVQASRGHLDAAIPTWHALLDTMDGVRSGRTRDAVVQMRRALSPVRGRGGSAAADLDERARTLLRNVG